MNRVCDLLSHIVMFDYITKMNPTGIIKSWIDIFVKKYLFLNLMLPNSRRLSCIKWKENILENLRFYFINYSSQRNEDLSWIEWEPSHIIKSNTSKQNISLRLKIKCYLKRFESIPIKRSVSTKDSRWSPIFHNAEQKHRPSIHLGYFYGSKVNIEIIDLSMLP